MPLAIDPEARLPHVLESDRGKKQPPRFFLRPLTVRQFRVANSIDERMQAAEDRVTVLMDGIRIGLVGWENITSVSGEQIPYDPEALEDVLGMSEAVELMRAVQTIGKLDASEKKGSDSLPCSNTDNSADTASQESAETLPAK